MKLKEFILAAAPAFLAAEQGTAENIIVSPNAAALYGDTFPLIAEIYPDLNVMLVTRDLIPGAEEAYAEHDLSFYDTCNWGDMTDEMGEAIAARVQMESSMALTFFNYASGDEIFIPETELINGIKRDPTLLSTMATSTLGNAYDGIASAITLNHYFPSMEGTVGIITMPNEKMNPFVESSDLSGLATRYLSITATGQDHMIHTVGHEIGHLVNRDGADEVQIDVTYCSSVNVESSDRGVVGEAYADVEGALFLKAAEKRGLTSGADIIGEVGHLRSIGTLMIPGNSYVVDSSVDMVVHLTNTAYDPTQEGYREAFDYSSLKGISILPLLINNFADTLAGYSISIHKKEMIATVPGFFTNEDKEYYGGLPDDPKEVADNAYQYAWIGANERQYEGNPSYHYAAIRYMRENGVFEGIKASLRPEYAAALDDMVADYMAGVEAVAPNLYNRFESSVKDTDVSNGSGTTMAPRPKFNYSKFEEQMKSVDVSAIGNDIFAISDMYQKNPSDNSGYKALYDTTNFIVKHMIR